MPQMTRTHEPTDDELADYGQQEHERRAERSQRYLPSDTPETDTALADELDRAHRARWHRYLATPDDC